jgi:hypothetical protein
LLNGLCGGNWGNKEKEGNFVNENNRKKRALSFEEKIWVI